MDLNNLHSGTKLIKQVLEQKRPVKKPQPKTEIAVNESDNTDEGSQD